MKDIVIKVKRKIKKNLDCMILDRIFTVERRQKKAKKYLMGLNKSLLSNEILNIIKFVERDGFSMFPYEFTRKYSSKKHKIFYDNSCKMHYVLHNRRRLYFPKTWSECNVQGYYNGILLEQDVNSPHRYEIGKFKVKCGEIIADIGAAEGVWALDNVDKAKEVYLFECDENWIAALKKTFEPYKKKTVIVNKYISDKTDKSKITIDDYFKNKKIDFIKADIEGYEESMLKGATKTFAKQKDMKVIVCAYHRQGDETLLNDFLEQAGFITEYSKGYVLYSADKKMKEPYLRRGLIRAYKV